MGKEITYDVKDFTIARAILELFYSSISSPLCLPYPLVQLPYLREERPPFKLVFLQNLQRYIENFGKQPSKKVVLHFKSESGTNYAENGNSNI